MLGITLRGPCVGHRNIDGDRLDRRGKEDRRMGVCIKKSDKKRRILRRRQKIQVWRCQTCGKTVV